MAFLLTGALVVMGALGLAIGAPLSSSSSSSSSPAFAMGGAGGDFVLNNGVVSATVSNPGGLTSMHELKAPGAGVKPLTLRLAADEWQATVRPGAAPKLRRFLITTKPPAETRLASTECTPQSAKASQPDNLTAILSWSCAPTDVGQEQARLQTYTVEAVYTLQPTGAFVTKTLCIASTADFFVSSVTPWTRLSVAAAGATKPATWLNYNNGFNNKLEIAGFARFGELNRGIFVTVQNPFGKYSDGPAVSPYAPPPPAGPCPSNSLAGQNHVGDDLNPGGTRGLSIAGCQALCQKSKECLGFVYLPTGCDAQPSNDCYLKANITATASGLGCACTVAKPFKGSPWQVPGPPSPPAPSAPTGGIIIGATYAAGVAQSPDAINPQYHEGEGVTLGLTALSAYYNDGLGTHYDYEGPHSQESGAPPVGPHGKPASVPTGLNTGEYIAFTKCVETYLLDKEARANKTVKVNVAWDENDYQIDVGTEAGMTEYKRIIDRNSEFGVSHVVYEPFNSLRSSRKTATDGWGWEGSLWLSMGEQIRNGSWAPKKDKMPAEIQSMIDYATSKNVKLMGYVYPCLDFVGGSGVPAALKGGSMDLSNRAFQKWMTSTMLDFLEVTGGGGFAWDHNIFAGGEQFQYAQWRAWMEILKELRAHYPEMVMDHRQTAHEWGPWYQLAGSYNEPIAGDENPETYGVPIASLHTDHVAGDNTRLINYKYAQNQLQPPSRIPGFIFHQTERTDDNGTMPCAGAGSGRANHWLCYDMNIRDFDLLGYKYSVLSTVGTAGQNLVVTMIPARDVDEFTMLPQSDRDFISGWLNWTDANLAYLRNTLPIATLLGPGLGRVDGTAAMYHEEGYIFLFNPSMRRHNASLIIDESLGLTNASVGYSYAVSELFPRKGASVGTWKQGQHVLVEVGGSNARVLQIKKSAIPAHGSSPKVLVAPLALPAIYQAMPISGDTPAASNTGGSFSTRFTIPGAIRRQLAARAKAYPIAWTARDRIATWLDPNRLLGSIFIQNPQDGFLGKITLTVDSAPVQVRRSYNSRGLNHSRTFLGYYFDASAITADAPHKLHLELPTLPAGAFTGIFWENVETVY